MKRCFIFAAGTYYGLRERPQTGDLVLAADAGYLACRQAGITPDLLLGDFDSMDQPADFDHVCRVPVEKDDTDTMLAVKTGLERVLHLRRHRRQAAGPHPGQSADTAVSAPPWGQGIPL